MDTYYNKPGATTLHEVCEAYQGAKISQSQGKSSGDSSAPGNVYEAAHNAAPPQSGSVYEKVMNSRGKELKYPFKGAVRAEWSVKKTGSEPQIIQTINLK